MENKIWSRGIQGISTLDLSRELWFKDERKDLYLKILGLKKGTKVLDAGCGPGTIPRKLANWLGVETKIVGVDRDNNFIQYAKEKAQEQGITNIDYIEGNALNLNFEDNEFDSCISNTLIEHVPNREFLLEQKRVCKPGGRVSVMYVLKEQTLQTQSKSNLITNEEIKLMDRLFSKREKIIEDRKVGKYWPDPIGLPKLFEELNFKNIQIDAIAIPIVIDDARLCLDEKITYIEMKKKEHLEMVNLMIDLNKNSLNKEEEGKLRRFSEERFELWTKSVKSGEKSWDYEMRMIQIVSGKVEK